MLCFFCVGLVYGLDAQRPDVRRPQSQPSNPAGARTQNAPATFANTSDTTTRPPLEIKTRPIVQLDSAFVHADTLLKNLYYFNRERLSKDRIRSVGSVYSSSINYQLISPVNTMITNGHSGHDGFLISTDLDSVMEVNRSLFKIEYRRSALIKANEITVKFARRFASDLLLNFDYEQFDDANYFPENRVKGDRIDFKIAKYNRLKTRYSLFYYQQGKIDENLVPVLAVGELRGDLSLIRSRFGLSHVEFLDRSGAKKLYTNISIAKSNTDLRGTVLETRPYLFQNEEFGDSIRVSRIDNEFRFDNRLELKMDSFDIVVHQDFARFFIDLPGISRSLWQSSTGLDVERNLSHRETLHLGARLNVSGLGFFYNVKGTYQFDKEDIFKGKLKLGINQKMVDSYRFYQSVNESSISYEFVKPQVVYFNAEVQQAKSNTIVGLNFSQERDPILWRRGGYRQFDKSLLIGNIDVSNIQMIGNFELRQSLLLQRDFSELLALADMMYTLGFYAHVKTFSTRMSLIAGVDSYFITDHILPRYDLVSGEFYRDDASLRRSGHIIDVRPSVSFRVENFSAFIRVDNALSRLYETRRFLMHEYPMHDFRIRLGLSWTLLD